MRLLTFPRLALLAAILLSCGCSNNKGKIELTKWSSLAATVKGVSVPDGTLQLAFGGDNRMIYTINPPNGASPQVLRGTYSLGMSDMVTLQFDQELAGSKTHVETIVINGNRLVMTDTDGTSLTFVKK